MTSVTTLTSIVAGAAAMIALAAGGMGAESSQAAPAGTAPACPASLRSVPGGARDASARGFDDGIAGGAQAYRPGQVLLKLDAGTSAREFACVLRELGAVKLAGGRGRAGFAGMNDLLLVQLPPARSVAATSRLLRAPRYRHLVDAAQPNWVAERKVKAPCPAADADPAPFPNDTLFPWQWGLDTGNEAARSNQPTIAADVPCEDVLELPGDIDRGTNLPMKVGDATETMRIVQAWSWPGLKRWYWTKRSVKIGIVDDSLVQHPDLEGSVLRGGSRVITPSKITLQRMKILASQGTFRIVTAGPNTTCDIAHDATADDIRAALERRVQIMCGVPASASPRFNGLRIVGSQGSVVLSIDGHPVTLQANLLTAPDSTGDMLEAEITRQSPPLAAQIAANTLRLARVRLPGNCPDDALESECGYWMLGRTGAIASTRVVADASALLKFVGLGRGRGEVTMWPSRYGLRASNNEPKTFEAAAPAPNPESNLDPERWTFQPAGAATVENVVAEGFQAVEPPDPTWPGQAAGDVTAKHGQMIAGIIGAQANNGRGMAGVLGPNVTAKLMTAVTTLDTASELVAIEYMGGFARVPVVNWSLGSITRPGQSPDKEVELINPQGVDARPVDLVQEQMGNYPRTLFVVAAGNTGTNLNHLGPRGADTYGNGTMDYAPCAPKGMGITNPPGRSAANRSGQQKGGALSMLRMPDGTFDRGNILCVAAMAPPRQQSTDAQYKDRRPSYLAGFSSWGVNVVDVAAPGQGVVGTGLGGTYHVQDGTSFAAPLVAGVAGLINARYPGIDASLVKCAILSSATSAPLSTGLWTSREHPFTGYTLPAGSDWAKKKVLTVPGMVVATEALSAAAHLKNRTSGFFNGRAVGRGEGPTCVQERGDHPTDPDRPGPWANTGTTPVPVPGPVPPAP